VSRGSAHWSTPAVPYKLGTLLAICQLAWRPGPIPFQGAGRQAFHARPLAPSDPRTLALRSCGTFGPQRKAVVGGTGPSASARPLLLGARTKQRHGDLAGIRLIQSPKSGSKQGWPGSCSGDDSINRHLPRGSSPRTFLAGMWEAWREKGETHVPPSPSTKRPLGSHVSAGCPPIWDAPGGRQSANRAGRASRRGRQSHPAGHSR
jgi:hypothetical protein